MAYRVRKPPIRRYEPRGAQGRMAERNAGIMDMWRLGEPAQAIADRYGISRARVWDIVRRELER